MKQRTPDHHRIASWMSEIRLTLARPADRETIVRLAALDSTPAPPAPQLLAWRDGEPCAAISLVTGDVVSNPFLRTVEVVELLLCHAAAARMDPGDELLPDSAVVRIAA